MFIKLENGEIICKEIVSIDGGDIDDELVGHPDSIYNCDEQKARINWLISQNMRKPIMDIGTACGYILEKVCNGSSEGIGIDIRCDRLLVAKRKYPVKKFYYANVLNLSSFCGKGIKSIILSEILEHLKFEYCHFAIIHCLNVIGKDGVIYYTVPNAYLDITIDQNPEHKWYPNIHSINSVMEVVGKHIRVGYTVNEVSTFLCGTVWRK